jgi:hypothetical protein
MATEPIQEFDKMLMRGNHILNIHDSLLLDLDDKETIFGKLFHVLEFVQLVKILRKFDNFWFSRVLGDEWSTFYLHSIFTADEINESVAEESSTFNFFFARDGYFEPII